MPIKQAINQGCPILLGPLTQEVVQDLTTDHANVLVILKSNGGAKAWVEKGGSDSHVG